MAASEGKNVNLGKLHLGTIGWSYNFWKGSFYPSKVSSKDYLSYYATKFNTVEVDSSFYRIPTKQAATNWKNQTCSHFVFSLKFPKVITHIKMLKDCKRETELFLERAQILNEKLGPFLLQFPSNFGPEHFSNLDLFLQNLPKTHRYVVEVRNKGFLNEDFYTLLMTNNIALAWVDSPSMPQIEKVTSDFLYVRWEGDRKKVNGTLGKIETNQKSVLNQWANKIIPYLRDQMQVFGYFGKYFSGYPPSDANLLLNLIIQG
jgi:uncharacterized protein YecE (DUF72 family)